MPTYADTLPYQVTAPVRLTISRGAPREPGSNEYSQEVWEEEVLMDHETVAVEGILNERNEEDGRGITLKDVLQRSGAQAGSGLLVVDTNALLSHLPLLDALHAGIMHLNLHALQHSGPASPLTLVIPAVVLSELDGLKRSPRRSDGGNGKPVSIASREATHWILSALQQQRKAFVKSPVDGQEVGLPQSSWGMHVQTKASESDVARSVGDGWHSLSPDERIIALCSHLQAQTQQPTFLCTNDTNARARAEVEGVRTLAIHDVLGRRSATDFCPPLQECQRIAQELLEQWIEQVSGIPASTSSSPEQSHMMRQQSDQSGFSASHSSASLPMSDDVEMAMDEDEPRTAPTSIGSSDAAFASTSPSSVGRNLSDSIHAVQGYVPPPPPQHRMPAYTAQLQSDAPPAFFNNHRRTSSPRAVPIPLSADRMSSDSDGMSRSLSPSADRLSSSSMWAPGNAPASSSSAHGNGHGMSRAWNSYNGSANNTNNNNRNMSSTRRATGSNTMAIVGQRNWGA